MRSLRLILATGLLLAAGAAAALPGLASGAAFQRGDVFISGAGNTLTGALAGTYEYSPDGQLRQAVSGSFGDLCFDPSGRYLISPGSGTAALSGGRIGTHR